MISTIAPECVLAVWTSKANNLLGGNQAGLINHLRATAAASVLLGYHSDVLQRRHYVTHLFTIGTLFIAAICGLGAVTRPGRASRRKAFAA